MNLKKFLRIGLLMSLCCLLMVSCKKDSSEPDKPEPTPVTPNNQPGNQDNNDPSNPSGNKDPNNPSGNKDPNNPSGGTEDPNNPSGGNEGPNNPSGGNDGGEDPSGPNQKTFTIAYDVEIIDGDASQTVQENQQLALSQGPKYPKADYRFDGWKDAAGNIYKPGQSITASMDLSLSAIWVFEPKIVFDGNGFGGKVPEPIKFANDEAQIPAASLSRDGYDFLGWDTNRDSRQALYTAGSKVKSAGKSVTLFAVWKPREYQYTFRYVYGKSNVKIQPFSAKDIASGAATFEITLYGNYSGAHVGWRDVDTKQEYKLMDVFDELKDRTFEPIVIEKSDASMEKWTIKKY